MLIYEFVLTVKNCRRIIMGIINYIKRILTSDSIDSDRTESIMMDDKKTARERELSSKMNGSNDFIMTPDSIQGTNIIPSSSYMR